MYSRTKYATKRIQQGMFIKRKRQMMGIAVICRWMVSQSKFISRVYDILRNEQSEFLQMNFTCLQYTIVFGFKTYLA